MMDCGVPAMVMARSVELGNMSPATCTWAPADYKGITTWRSYTPAIRNTESFLTMECNPPLWFPWFCSHLCQWVSHTDWQAQQGEWWPVVCWWPYCSSSRCLCPGQKMEKKNISDNYTFIASIIKQQEIQPPLVSQWSWRRPWKWRWSALRGLWSSLDSSPLRCWCEHHSADTGNRKYQINRRHRCDRWVTAVLITHYLFGQ